MHEVMRRYRGDLGLSQADLAARVGVHKRQIRRYEAGEAQPSLSVARAVARALGITVDELAGEEARRPELTGTWWANWQSWKDGEEVLNPHEVRINTLRGETYQILAVTRGTPLEGGGYLWDGELRLFDNDVLMGWYVANEAAVRSRGTMFFNIHQHGVLMTGRWVGLSYDGPCVTGLAAMARHREEAVSAVTALKEGRTP